MKTARNPPDIHAPVAGYVHQIEIKGPSQLLVISGQIGMTPNGKVPDDSIEQFALSLDNVVRNLDAAGMRREDLVKLNVYLVGAMDSGKRWEVMKTKLNGHKPCMTLVYVAALANPALKVEIEAWAESE